MAKNRVNIELGMSVNTSTVDEDVKQFGDATAPHVKNTGIERDGGITNIYEVETTYPATGQYELTEDGQTLAAETSGATRIIKQNGKTVGVVSGYGVE